MSSDQSYNWDDWDESEEAVQNQNENAVQNTDAVQNENAIQNENAVQNTDAVHSMPSIPLLPQLPLVTSIPQHPIPGMRISSGPSNPIIIPLTQSILNVLFGSEYRIRRRELEPEVEPELLSDSEPELKRIKTNPHETYAFTLTSGEEFYFSENDGKNILINETIEPNIWVRKIISNLPHNIKERLRYLAKFRFDEQSENETELDENNEYRVAPKKFNHVPTQVFSAYIREMKLRTIFRSVLARWRIYHLNKKEHEDIDPITQSPPIKKVELYDWKHKKKYIFDAASLATLIESKLLYQEYGFPMPNYPKNPWTNVEFTYYEMISIYYQLHIHGELRWGLITLKQHDFNKAAWQLYHKSALIMKAIRNNITVLDNRDAYDMLEDFIFSKMEELRIEVTPYLVNVYRTAMRNCPYHWYIELWKGLAFQHFEAEHFGHNRYLAIQAASKALLKKQEIFIKELVQKGIL